MTRQLLLGNEAAAQAAIDAGIVTAYAYPGTPSTEILEYLLDRASSDPGFRASWAANEKVAFEQAVGTSFTGGRSVVAMKHVGLNVAADPFLNAAITGAQGGLVLLVADDPGMHSSQNEQDSRWYADMARVPCLEPGSQQQAYDMTREAFDLSERFGLPVAVRFVTRLAHSRAGVETRPRRGPNRADAPVDRGRWTLLPGNARLRYRRLVEKTNDLRAASEQSPWNELRLRPGPGDLGVVAAGVAWNYFREAAGDDPPSWLRLGQYPLPRALLLSLFERCRRVLVLEDGYPYVERLLRGELPSEWSERILGRATGHLPPTGELDPDVVARALGSDERAEPVSPLVRPRPPQLCPGCPHRDTYRALATVRERYPGALVAGDIGCYTLGFYPPHEAIDSCLDMGASIGMAKGAADAGRWPVFGVIGDSTFGHSGLPALLTAAAEDTDMNLVVLDNSTTAMTGAQDSFATGDRIVDLCRALGAAPDHVRVLTPLPARHEQNVDALLEEVEHPGLSVLVFRRPCLRIRKEKRAEPAAMETAP